MGSLIFSTKMTFNLPGGVMISVLA